MAIDISEAILKVTQSGHVETLEQKMLHHLSCNSSAAHKADDIRLGPGPFSGLFLVLGCILAFALVVAVARLLKKRDYMWASRVLSECCTTSLRKESVDMNVTPLHAEMGPS